MTDAKLQLAARACAAALGVIGSSCGGGTQTGNPLVGFESSGCKKAGAETLLTRVGIAVTRSGLWADSARYDGLQCFGWELDEGGMLVVDVVNMPGGCAIDWEARAELDEDHARLFVENPRCDVVAGCGSCVYDLSFQLQGIAADAPLALQLWQQGGCEPAELEDELVLPLDSQRQGLRCRPADRGLLMWVDHCGGELHSRCGADCEFQATSCQDGLMCAEIEPGDSRCMQSCERDADCPLEGVLRCDDGLCRIDPAHAL